ASVGPAEVGAQAQDLPLTAEAIVLMGAAIIFAPLFKRLGLGTILGYLAAGVMIGPVLRIITEPEEHLHFAELGIVFLLFIIGLELKPARLWALRKEIFGIGLLQVVFSALILGGICFLFGYSWQTSVMVGLGLALSSTAFGVQILTDRGELNTNYGQKAFSVVLFQDIAIVPILAIIPFLVPHWLATADGTTPESAFSFWALLKVLGATGGLIILGHYVTNPLFRVVASAGAREMMIVVALFIVLGAGLITQAAGLSMAMGAFVAGVMLAESAYRHELEANIDPFRGILLGLFFMAVGMSLDLSVVLNYWYIVLFAAPAIMAIKAVILYAIVRPFGANHQEAVHISALLPQVGEFAFVIFSTASLAGVVSVELSSIITAIVTVTMAITPLTIMFGSYLVERTEKEDEIDEDYEGAGGQAFIIGFGRFGQTVAQTLLAQGIKVTVIDHDAEQIRSAAKFGFRIYYGEGMRIEVLKAAGIDKARVVALCSGGKARTTTIAKLIKTNFPEIKVYARAYDRVHSVELMELGSDAQVRELFESALIMGRSVLDGMDVPPERAQFVVEDVRKRDMTRLQLQQTQGIFSANEFGYRTPLAPEPLMEP
ncbi:MAG: monovalent cation:proton antiporter-2 (CPA2) family protein, partial [Pseudomonadota bacterium]